MRTSLRFVAPAAACLAGVMLTPDFASAQACSGNWKCKVDYGANTVMDLYVPTNVDPSPGIVVSLHYCSGNSSNARGWFQASADKYGFIIIAPSAGGNCFDAKPERSGERDNISKMVKYVITQNHADPKRVFAAGASSGACMTNALMAAYPDVFAGGSVLAGVPAGAWTGGNAYGWSTPADRSAAAWGDIVRGASKDFTGTRPRLQLWHGKGDNTLNFTPNFAAEVAQWTNVLGVTDADATKGQTFKASQDTWDRTTYKNSAGTVVLETDVAPNAPHDLSGRGLWDDVVRFFGLDMDAPAGGVGGGGAGGGSSVGGGGAATSGGSAGAPGVGSGGGGGGGTSGVGVPAGGSPSATGGSKATAGAPSGGGAAGATSSAGGSAPTGGTVAEEDGGCSVAAAGHRSGGALVGLLLAGFGALFHRRRRSTA